jgi:putative DNA primase/helicase
VGEHPFELVIRRLQEMGCRVTRKGYDTARCICPSHRDARPSLAVTKTPDRVLFHCFAGCRPIDVLTALNLKSADLFIGPPVPQERSKVIAEYDYVDPTTGEVLATKVRFHPKRFRWRGADGRWGLNGASPGLYRHTDMVHEPQVLIVEGEKAVEELRRRGLPLSWPHSAVLGLPPAVCPPAGAGHWRLEWSLDLWRAGARELIVLPDADRSGRQHAERVAVTSYGAADLPSASRDDGEPWSDWPLADPADPEVAPLAVKIVALPDLPPGGDVVDWFERGHDVAELRTLIATTPLWSPDGADRARRDRRRELTRARVRRHRQRLQQLLRVSVSRAA